MACPSQPEPAVFVFESFEITDASSIHTVDVGFGYTGSWPGRIRCTDDWTPLDLDIEQCNDPDYYVDPAKDEYLAFRHEFREAAFSLVEAHRGAFHGTVCRRRAR
jgi:hypothetical protein